MSAPRGVFYKGEATVPWEEAYLPATPSPAHKWNPRNPVNLAAAKDAAASIKDAIERKDFKEYKRNGGYFEEGWWL